VKLAFNGLHSAIVRSLILGHSWLFRTAFPPRQVNNIYFDTVDLDLRSDHIQGAYQRKKIRLRWYGSKWSFSSSQLEIKSKIANLGSKRTYPIMGELDLTKLNWRDMQSRVLSQLPLEIHPLLDFIRPILISIYQREYYVSADGLIRITLDTDAKAYSQSFGGNPNLTKLLPMRNVCILEIKAGANCNVEIAEVLAEFPQYACAFSKYLQGTGSIPL
jgi:hypothetical protein